MKSKPLTGTKIMPPAGIKMTPKQLALYRRVMTGGKLPPHLQVLADAPDGLLESISRRRKGRSFDTAADAIGYLKRVYAMEHENRVG